MTDYTKLVSIGDKFGMLTVIDELPKRHFASGAKRIRQEHKTVRTL